jgi:hypothetical protein
MFRPIRVAALLLPSMMALSACQWIQQDLSKGLNYGRSGDDEDSIKARDLAASKVTTIGVNAYLWRAALDTVSFMPLLQTDSNGGVIVTDWYVNPAVQTERMKLTVTILDQDLRADALRVAASRQELRGGQWVEAPVQAATVQKLEDIILTKARDLRRASIDQ